MNLAPSSGARWADLNLNAVVANTLVIAAWTAEPSPDDQFKINQIEFCQPVNNFSLGNRIWLDNGQNGGAANNGLQDGTEPGIPGVSVQLKNSGGAVIATATTDNLGYYRFDGLTAGSTYSVFVPAANFASGQPLSGLVSSTATQTGDKADKGLDNVNPPANGIGTGNFTLAAVLNEPDIGSGAGAHGPAGDANDNLTFDFGFVATVTTFSLGNRVWLDNGAIPGGIANNRHQDGTEPGVSGVTVQLKNNLGAVIGTTSTDSLGYYRFDNIPAGTGYQVCLPASNFTAGGPLNGMVSSTGVLAGSDQYDNGVDANPAVQGICSGLVDLGPGIPPTGETDLTGSGAGAHGPGGDTRDDLTVDFGFFATPTLAWLTAIEAYLQDGTPVVAWQTASEVGTIGFHLYRQGPAAAEWTRVNPQLVPAANAVTGGRYHIPDPTAVLGGQYTYGLAELEENGAQRVLGPFTVTVTAKPARPAPVHADQSTPTPTANPKQARAHARLAALAEAQSKAVDLDAYHHAQVLTRQEGLHYLSAATLADVLHRPVAEIQGWIANGALGLYCLDTPATYIPAQNGAGLYFYAEAVKNNYTDANVYWLTSTPNPEIVLEDGGSPPAVTAQWFAAQVRLERDLQVAPTLTQTPEADYWMWSRLVAGHPQFDRQQYTFDLQDLVPNAPSHGRLMLRLHGGGASQHTVAVTINGQALGQQSWHGKRPLEFEVSIPIATLKEGANILSLQALLPPNTPASQVYLDWFIVEYPRAYRARNGQLVCDVGDYEVITVDGFNSPNIAVFEMMVPRLMRLVYNYNVEQTHAGYRVSLLTEDPGRRFLAFQLDTVIPAQEVRLVQLAGLADPAQKADYLIVAPPELVGAATDLAAYRQSQGLTPKIVSLDDIYNEFGFGLPSPRAIQQFLAIAHARWALKPRYVVLVGDGTYDYKDRQKQADNLVPPLMVATSAGLFPSDSALGDLDGDGRPELAVGRLPVMTAAELQTILAKMKVFEAQGWPANPQAL
ncbi:MAG: hypothetical protein FJ387_31055, partial [Verrucomicrobia bacterium]|nr:hypothetical protein [Verrucomicrobiota bacterium]